MSLHTALKAIGIVFVGLLLLPAFVAMGPVGWTVVGVMLMIGVLQVHRERSRDDSAGKRPAYCPNCGSQIDAYADDYETRVATQWQVEYCPDCGAPLASGTESESRPRRGNCPDCGAVVDPEDSECDYCRAEL